MPEETLARLQWKEEAAHKPRHPKMRATSVAKRTLLAAEGTLLGAHLAAHKERKEHARQHRSSTAVCAVGLLSM